MMTLFGSILAEAIDKIGANGVISIESFSTSETYIIVEKGMKVYDSDGNGKVTFNDIIEVLSDMTGSFMTAEQREIYDTGRRVWTTKGEDQEAAKKELIEHLKVLEQELRNKSYFGGDEFGFVDVVFIPFYSWFHAYETLANFKIEESCPKIIELAKRCMQRESVAKALPDQNKVYEFILELKKRFGI
uniref:Glutathione S-transferase n=1 Tax=Chenopodium quinoa TaxID=63459 RepID=A0A803M869_CHEQI